MRPRLKSLNCLRGDGTLLISLDPRTRVELADPTGQVLALILLLREGSRTPAQLRDALAETWPSITQPEVDDALEQLDALGWLEAADGTALLSPYERERYFSNLAFFDAFTRLDVHRESFQRRMLDSHVVVLGTGGLGSSVVQNLAGLGIGRLTLVDFDCVELKNLARQFTYSEAQIGRSKVHEVAGWLRAFNSGTAVTAIRRRIERPDDIAPLLEGANLVVSAIDQPDDIDLIVNHACMRGCVPFIRGGLSYTQGLYWSVNPGHSACRLCLEAYRRTRAQNEDAAVVDWPAVLRAERPNRGIGPVAQMLGALVAMEALRYLTGIVAPVSAGTYQLVDFAGDCHITTDAWPADPECPLCTAVEAKSTRSPEAALA